MFRLLDEAVGREAVGVGNDDGHLVGVLALGQAKDRHAALGADHFKMKARTRTPGSTAAHTLTALVASMP